MGVTATKTLCTSKILLLTPPLKNLHLEKFCQTVGNFIFCFCQNSRYFDSQSLVRAKMHYQQK